jgi:leader peptidase (prepilin peptidase) / N-methyltransferase
MIAVAGACAALAAMLYWAIAAHAATRRCLTIGTLPPQLLALVAGGAAIACADGARAASIAALAGVAVAGWADARTGAIFDPLTLSITVASLALSAAAGNALDGAYGAGAAGAALLLLYAVTDGRGLGLGDVKLGAALGMALGAAAGLTALGLAFIFGAVYGVWLLATKRAHAESAVRFAPFIAAGTFATVLLPLTAHR